MCAHTCGVWLWLCAWQSSLTDGDVVRGVKCGDKHALVCAASAGAHGLVLCDWFVAACWLVCCCCSKWECIHCAFMLSSFVCVPCFVECAHCCCGKNDCCKGAGARQSGADERTQVMMENVVCSETLEGNGVADVMEGGVATRVLVLSCIEHTVWRGVVEQCRHLNEHGTATWWCCVWCWCWAVY